MTGVFNVSVCLFAIPLIFIVRFSYQLLYITLVTAQWAHTAIYGVFSYIRAKILSNLASDNFSPVSIVHFIFK